MQTRVEASKSSGSGDTPMFRKSEPSRVGRLIQLIRQPPPLITIVLGVDTAVSKTRGGEQEVKTPVVLWATNNG